MRPATQPPSRSASRLRASPSQRMSTASHSRVAHAASLWPLVLTATAVLSMLGLVANILWLLLR